MDPVDIQEQNLNVLKQEEEEDQLDLNTQLDQKVQINSQQNLKEHTTNEDIEQSFMIVKKIDLKLLDYYQTQKLSIRYSTPNQHQQMYTLSLAQQEKTIPQLKFQDPINDQNLKNQIGIKIEKVEIKSEHQSHTINQANTQNQENLLSQNDIVNQDQQIKEDRVIKEEEQTQNQTHDQVYEKIENIEFEVKYYMKIVVKTNSYEKIKEIQSVMKHESNSHNQNEQKMQIDAQPDLSKKGEESKVKDLYSNIDEQIESYIDNQALQTEPTSKH
eukprot:403377324